MEQGGRSEGRARRAFKVAIWRSMLAEMIDPLKVNDTHGSWQHGGLQ